MVGRDSARANSNAQLGPQQLAIFWVDRSSLTSSTAIQNFEDADKMSMTTTERLSLRKQRRRARRNGCFRRLNSFTQKFY